MKINKFILFIIAAGFIATPTITVQANDYRTNSLDCLSNHSMPPQSFDSSLEYDEKAQATLSDDGFRLAFDNGHNNAANLFPAIASANAPTESSQPRRDDEKSFNYSFVPQPRIFSKITNVQLHWRTVKFFNDNAILSIGDNDGNSQWQDKFDQFPFDGAWANRDTGHLDSQPDGFRFLNWSFWVATTKKGKV